MSRGFKRAKDLSDLLKIYVDVYLKPEFSDSYFVEFSFNKDIYNHFEITTPIDKKSKIGIWLLHKGIVK